MKKGWTTGACAQAAARAAAKMLLSGRSLHRVMITLPCGAALTLPVIEAKIGRGFARCAVVKDSGDDPDITNGIRVYATARFCRVRQIRIEGGRGVGRVTRPGLPVAVGEYAINPVPRKMILRELACYLPRDKGLEVIISIPEGERLAKKTYNPRLGIVGGLSVIGTTGIVIAKSTAAYKKTLAMQLDVLRAQGYKTAYLVLGYLGERFFARPVGGRRGIPNGPGRLPIAAHRLIKVGDYVGWALGQCARRGITRVVLAGYIGKLIKLTRGQFDTHYSRGDKRIAILADYARSAGASPKVLDEIRRQTSAAGAVNILRRNRLKRVFRRITQDVATACRRQTQNKIKTKIILLGLDARPLS